MRKAVPEESWPERQGDLFRARFAKWQMLRARIAQHEQEADVTSPTVDAEAAELDQQLEDATRLVMTTHAPQSWMIWQKFEILEHALSPDGTEPMWADKRQIWMLAAIKADLMAQKGTGE